MVNHLFINEGVKFVTMLFEQFLIYSQIRIKDKFLIIGKVNKMIIYLIYEE